MALIVFARLSRVQAERKYRAEIQLRLYSDISSAFLSHLTLVTFELPREYQYLSLELLSARKRQTVIHLLHHCPRFMYIFTTLTQPILHTTILHHAVGFIASKMFRGSLEYS